MKFIILAIALLICPLLRAEIAAPVIPDRSFNVKDFGAVGDGKTKDTGAIAKTMNACAGAGGGKIVIPEGQFLTGPLTFQSSMELHLDKGAVLLISDDSKDFKNTNHRFENCISFSNCHDVKISGEGTIDGQGASWWKDFVLPKGTPAGTAEPDHRPFLVVLTDCQRVRVEGITLTNSPMFHLVPQGCQDVEIDGVTIKAPSNGPNTDGIDPSGINFHIANCHIDVGDDCIALKPSRRVLADHPACENFVIENCQFLAGHGMSIGNPTPGGLKGLTVRNCTFDGTDCGIRMKTSRSAGGVVEDCNYDNLSMKNVRMAIQITSYYPRIPPAVQDDPAQPIGPTTPIWRNIHISNVTATGSASAGEIIGVAESPMSDVTLDHVNISANTGMKIIHAKNVSFTDCQITAATGDAFTLSDAQVNRLPK